MPPHIGRREQRQLKWLHGVSPLIQQGVSTPARFSRSGEALEATTLIRSTVVRS